MFGARVVAKLELHKAEVVVRMRVSGIERNRRCMRSRSGYRISPALQHYSQVHVSGRR